jgi:hypothetical protein
MKWLVVGLWLVFTAGVLYWIEIKQNVIYIPETIVIQKEVIDEDTTEESEYSGATQAYYAEYGN